jgi:hypothetical protein
MFLMPGSRAGRRKYVSPTMVSGAFIIQPWQSGSLIGLAGNAFYTVTLGPVSAYPFGFSVTIANQNNNRGKLIVPTGGASFILWPTQTCRVFVAANGTWKVDKQNRWKLAGNRTLFVDAALGSDSNDGLASGAGNAMQTLQGAIITLVQDQFDLWAFGAPQVTIQLADGTYTGGVHYPGITTGGSGNASILIKGNTTTPGNVIVQGDGAGNPPFAFFDGAVCELQGMQLQDSVGACLTAASNALIRFEGQMIFGACGAGQPHMQLQQGARVFVDAGYTINGNASGGAGYHLIIFEDAGFLAQNQAITIGANLSFNTFILAQRKAGVNLGGASFPGFASPATFTVTGKRWQSDDLSMISMFGGLPNTVIPGNANGTSSNGGLAA